MIVPNSGFCPPQAEYAEKHTQFASERKELEERLKKLDQSATLRMEHTLGIKDEFQTFEDLARVEDKQADIEAVRQVLDDDTDTRNTEKQL